MRRLQSDRGQATVLTVIFLAALLGAVAMVLDVGSWFRAQRDTQSTADAAALAAAQALPDNVGNAHGLAVQYLDKNVDANVADAGREISFSSVYATNDTISVKVNRNPPGVFSKLFGINSVNVKATAKARAGGIESAKWVAPIVVNIKHSDLNCDVANGKPVPCFGKPTQIDLDHLHKPGSGNAAGSFALINLEESDTGSAGASTVGEWILRGFDQYMSLGDYKSVPSAMFNDSHVKGAMSDRLKGDPVLLFPIYKSIIGSGSNAKYDVVGWVGFHVSSYLATGSTGKVNGAFTKVIWEGIQSQSGYNLNYGTRTIELVE